MRWRLTVNYSDGVTRSHQYSWPAEAWEAYDAAIAALEADGFVRRGMECVRYGASATQRLVGDASEVTVHLDRVNGEHRPPVAP